MSFLLGFIVGAVTFGGTGFLVGVIAASGARPPASEMRAHLERSPYHRDMTVTDEDIRRELDIPEN